MIDEYRNKAAQAMMELVQVAGLEEGDIVVIGCSSSEVAGEKIGTHPGPEIAKALLDGFMKPLEEKRLCLAAQCCEHLNRALVVEKNTMKMHNLQRVNAVPQPKAGGSFATAVWAKMKEPVLVEYVQAAAGIDVGDTLIGMHLRPVAVPVRLGIRKIGEANLVAARTRYKFIGGERAVYQLELL